MQANIFAWTKLVMRNAYIIFNAVKKASSVWNDDQAHEVEKLMKPQS